MDYGSLELAAAACEALWDACGGVTVDMGTRRDVRSAVSYQTRAGRRLRRGPSTEASFVKTRCVFDATAGGRDPWGGSVGGAGNNGQRTDRCAACHAVLADALSRLGTRRRSEAEVLSALDGSCARISKVAPAHQDRRRAACDELIEQFGDAIEASLQQPASTADDVCGKYVPECT